MPPQHVPPSPAALGEAPPHRSAASAVAPATAQARARRSHAVVAAGVVALIVLGLLWELWLAPTGKGTLAIKVLPLALALPGLWRQRLYTFRWLSLLVWLYVGEGLLRATSERGPSAPLAVAEVLLAMTVFIGCVARVRAHSALAGAGATAVHGSAR